MSDRDDSAMQQPDAPVTWRTVAGRWALAAVTVAVLGLAMGWLVSRSQPRLAAGALVADFVVPEPGDVDVGDAATQGPADPEAVAPSSGGFTGEVRCGVLDEVVDNDVHLATLAAGGIVVRYRADLAAADDDLPGELAAWAEGRAFVLVSPEPRLDVPLTALAWERRMELSEVRPSLLTAFLTAEVGFLEPPPGCEAAAP